MSGRGPLRVSIGALAVSGRSGVEARRVADALPRAIERALGALEAGTPLSRARSASDRAAHAIARRIRAAAEAGE